MTTATAICATPRVPSTTLSVVKQTGVMRGSCPSCSQVRTFLVLMTEIECGCNNALIVAQLLKEIDDYPEHVCCSREHLQKSATQVQLSPC